MRKLNPAFKELVFQSIIILCMAATYVLSAASGGFMQFVGWLAFVGFWWHYFDYRDVRSGKRKPPVYK